MESNFSDSKEMKSLKIYSLVSFSFGVLGTIMVVVALIMLIIFQKHPLFKTSTLFFAYAILIGLAFGNLGAILGIFEISPFICELKTHGYFQFSGIVYNSLLIKVIRIYRIFRASLRGISPVPFTSNLSVIIQFSCLLLVQVLHFMQ